MSGWRELRFGDVLNGSERNGIYKPKEFHGRGVKIVNMGELFAHPRLGDVEMKRLELTHAEEQRFLLATGDLIFARRSLTSEGAGKCSIVMDIIEPTTFESSIIRARPRPDMASPLFLYYLFGSPAGRHALDTIKREVAVSGITGTDLANLPLRLPLVEEQRAIAAVLSALDDKIALNLRMNETLEAAARALFRDWFVDFGPTRAKAQGAPAWLAPDLWSLFPDRLGDDDVPEGWQTYTVGDFAEQRTATLNPGASGDEVFQHYSLPAYDAGCSPALDTGHKIKSNKTLIPSDAVLLSKLNPEISRVWLPDEPGTIRQIASTEFLAFVPKESASRSLLFAIFRDDTFRQKMEGMVTGTSKSHQRISPPALRSAKAMVGSPEAFAAFDRLVSPLTTRLVRNRSESRALAETRDALLPKLMSGEVRVRDAEALVAA